MLDSAFWTCVSPTFSVLVSAAAVVGVSAGVCNAVIMFWIVEKMLVPPCEAGTWVAGVTVNASLLAGAPVIVTLWPLVPSAIADPAVKGCAADVVVPVLFVSDT